MISAAKIFQSLLGRWQFQRDIFNQGKAQGTATFEKIDSDPETLFYKEKGVFMMQSGFQYNIEREYVYRYHDDKISVYFVENHKAGELFHTLNFESNEASAFHQCKNDTYHGKYIFFNENKFQITYLVQGPQKNYISETIFLKTPN